VPANEPLRNPELVAALDAAVLRGDRTVFALLCRHSGLPGPRPNWKLAAAVGRHIASHGQRADALIRDLAGAAPSSSRDTTWEYLPICAAQALAARSLVGPAMDASLPLLRDLAEDTRHLVRDGVVAALVEVGRARPVELVSALAGWMDGYLPAAVALQAMTTRAWLDVVPGPGEILARHDEAFQLLEGASRADQRSQGYRTLLRAISESAAHVMGRFPGAAAELLAARAATAAPDLREALQRTVAEGRRQGQASSGLADVEKSLEASAPPRRDPRTYVGPTRKRGQKGAKRPR
jgi:hypothetical protein